MTTNKTTTRCLALGLLHITRNAADELVPEDVGEALERHWSHDWGLVDAEDRAANDHAVVEGTRVLSVYRDRRGTKFWIITEADRSATTILLPADY